MLMESTTSASSTPQITGQLSTSCFQPFTIRPAALPRPRSLLNREGDVSHTTLPPTTHPATGELTIMREPTSSLTWRPVQQAQLLRSPAPGDFSSSRPLPPWQWEWYSFSPPEREKQRPTVSSEYHSCSR